MKKYYYNTKIYLIKQTEKSNILAKILIILTLWVFATTSYWVVHGIGSMLGVIPGLAAVIAFSIFLFFAGSFQIGLWVYSTSLLYIIVGPIFEKVYNFINSMPLDNYYPKPLTTTTRNNQIFGTWRQNDMEIPIRTYAVVNDKLTVKFTIENYPFTSGGPSSEYKWIWLNEKNRMGWSNNEPDPIVTLIISDGFGTICDNICKEK